MENYCIETEIGTFKIHFWNELETLGLYYGVIGYLSDDSNDNITNKSNITSPHITNKTFKVQKFDGSEISEVFDSIKKWFSEEMNIEGEIKKIDK